MKFDADDKRVDERDDPLETRLLTDDGGFSSRLSRMQLLSLQETQLTLNRVISSLLMLVLLRVIPLRLINLLLLGKSLPMTKNPSAEVFFLVQLINRVKLMQLQS